LALTAPGAQGGDGTAIAGDHVEVQVEVQPEEYGVFMKTFGRGEAVFPRIV
jgi:hypothetical protein